MRSDLQLMETCLLLATSVVSRCVVLATSMKEGKAAKTVLSARPDTRDSKVLTQITEIQNSEDRRKTLVKTQKKKTAAEMFLRNVMVFTCI